MNERSGAASTLGPEPGGSKTTHERGRGPPLCGTYVSLYRIHFHRYWTDVRFRLVEISEVSAALTAPVGLPILCHKSLFDNDKHPRSRPRSDSSQSFPSLSLGSTGSKGGGRAEGSLTL